MTIIVCVDEHGGMLFNRRRVSSDRTVTGKIMELAGSAGLRVSPYSAKLFASCSGVYAADDYLSGASEKDVCFVEAQISAADLVRAERVVVFYWNRHYPSDVKFPLQQLQTMAQLESAEEFKGNSHEKITREVYVLSKS